eukprot:scaffold30342_cov157-Amphora_coffeaeformis.AAC.3
MSRNVVFPRGARQGEIVSIVGVPGFASRLASTSRVDYEQDNPCRSRSEKRAAFSPLPYRDQPFTIPTTRNSLLSDHHLVYPIKYTTMSMFSVLLIRSGWRGKSRIATEKGN